MPILYELHQNKDDLYFTDRRILTNENVTTIITGKNSVGKSRLLRSIVIKSLQNSDFKKVIAISNTQYHKFPSYREIHNKSFEIEKYIKLAFEANTSSFLRFMEKIDLPYNSFIKNLLQKNNIRTSQSKFTTNLNLLMCMDFFILKLAKNTKSKNILISILDFLNLDKHIKLNLFPINEFEDLINIVENYIENTKDINNEDYQSLIKLKKHILNLDNLRTIFLLDLDEDHIESLSFLIEHGLLRVRRISFFKQKQILSYKDLSSGELAILSLILSLSSTLEDDSIICIDEPELNLHPEWQEKIIQLIELIGDHFYGCHFFIATHSPQLISGVSNNNTFVLDLSKNKIYSIKKYKNRSSDFQLSEIFNFPGNNNEYLIRKLLVILNKINSEENLILDSDSIKTLNHVEELIYNEKIDKDDKVRILFELIKDFRG